MQEYFAKFSKSCHIHYIIINTREKKLQTECYQQEQLAKIGENFLLTNIFCHIHVLSQITVCNSRHNVIITSTIPLNKLDQQTFLFSLPSSVVYRPRCIHNYTELINWEQLHGPVHSHQQQQLVCGPYWQLTNNCSDFGKLCMGVPLRLDKRCNNCIGKFLTVLWDVDFHTYNAQLTLLRLSNIKL